MKKSIYYTNLLRGKSQNDFLLMRYNASFCTLSQYKRHKRLTKQESLTANIQRYTLIFFISYCLTYCASKIM